MSKSQSTYSGRKIRVEGQEAVKTESSLSNANPELGVMTFGEACAKGLLKRGMTVNFVGCVYGPTEFEQEETGKEQEVLCELTKGIVVKREDQLAIFAVLRLTLGLILQGRYGRANCLEIVNCLSKRAERMIKNCNSSILSINEFVDFGQDNPLVVDYLRETTFKVWEVVFANRKSDLESVRADTLQEKDINISPGRSEYKIYNVGIIIEGRDLECMLKKSEAITINHLHTFNKSSHEMHVEIRGNR